MGRTKRLITIHAGRLVRQVCYTQPFPRDDPAARAAKERCSTEARRLINARLRYEKLHFLLAANFDSGLFLTLTYGGPYLPDTRKAARAELTNYIIRLRQAFRAQGRELAYVYNTEQAHEHGRYHHHMVVNGTMDDVDLIASRWPLGDVKAVPIDGERLEELARYLTKEEPSRKVGGRYYSPSRGLKKPIRTSELVDSSFTLQAPVGAKVENMESKSNYFGNYDYLSYLDSS